MKRIELMTYRVRAPRTAIFPLDMLRYAASWPASAEAAAQIARSLECGADGRQEIELQTYEDPRTFEFSTFVKRWHSFGWIVQTRDEDGEWVSPGPFIKDAA